MNIPATSIPRQRFSLRAEYVYRPIGVIVDFFWDGFEVIPHQPDSRYQEVVFPHGVPSEVWEAMAYMDAGGYAFWQWVDHGKVIVPTSWLEPVTDLEYDLLEVAA